MCRETKDGAKGPSEARESPLVFKRHIRISEKKGKEIRIISVGFSRQDVIYRT